MYLPALSPLLLVGFDRLTVHCNNSRSKFVKQRFYKSAVKALELFRIYQHKKTPNGIVRNVLLRKVFKYCFRELPDGCSNNQRFEHSLSARTTS